MMKNTFFSLVIASSVLFVGCASQPTVSSSRNVRVPEMYTVKSGDSLSKIAMRYNLDYYEIARLNNIAVLDKIFVGQRLRLKAAQGGTYAAASPSRSSSSQSPNQGQSLAQQAQAQTIPLQHSTVQPIVNTANNTPAQATQPSVAAGNEQLNWVLPSRGQLVQKFDLNQDRKGVFFAGNIGDPVFAASAGEVVYADDGLKEYGNLILIRHTKGYISAYAHNSKLLVKVGDQVRAGQTIAEVGNSGTNRIWLQFQIRLNGKPIDPATLLPSY